MRTQAQKAADFAALHAAPGCFLIPNPWDVGSARALAGLGFKALTTTSAGYARSLGVTDYNAGRENVLEHVRQIAPMVDVPLAADLENGFGHAPQDCADTIRLGAEAGLVGGSIEDATGDKAAPIYEIAHAKERVAAAAAAARALPWKFMLVARCENYLHGRADFADTMKRVHAYVEAGADVIFTPGIDTVENLRTLCREAGAPVSLMMRPREKQLSLPELVEIGVKRVSVAGYLHVAAMHGMIEAAKKLLDGDIGFAKGMITGPELDALIAKGAAG